MARFKDQAIVVREFDWSETSQVVTLLTAAHGKVRGLAKGSKRTSPGSVSRYSGGFSVLTGGQVVGIVKPTTELATVTEWDLQEPYFHLRTDLRAQRLGFYAADLVHAMIADHDPHPAAYAAMREFLDRLADAATREAALLEFQWRLLVDCGYVPELEKDARTGKTLTEANTYLFDPRAGGLTTDGGVGGEESATGPWRVRSETVDVLRTTANKCRVLELSQAPGSDGEDRRPESLARANRLLCVYTRAILDRELPTMAFVLGGD